MFHRDVNIVKFHEELYEGAILKDRHRLSHMIVEKNCQSHRFLVAYLLKFGGFPSIK